MNLGYLYVSKPRFSREIPRSLGSRVSLESKKVVIEITPRKPQIISAIKNVVEDFDFVVIFHYKASCFREQKLHLYSETLLE
jgi:hypothetical protein